LEEDASEFHHELGGGGKQLVSLFEVFDASFHVLLAPHDAPAQSEQNLPLQILVAACSSLGRLLMRNPVFIGRHFELAPSVVAFALQ